MAKEVCPYYKSSTAMRITCKSTIADITITSTLAQRATVHKRKACRDDWRSCPIAKMLGNVKGDEVYGA